ncbi:MAG: pyridoxamine 5'-phosphate oxidase [Bacteroidia bacterium]
MDKLREHLIKLREDFTKGSLDEKDLESNPGKMFERWMQNAVDAQVSEVQAMTLSTVDELNKPSSRIVYLREFSDNQIWFYGNYTSRKAKAMEYNPNICLNFFWPDLQRQIRVEGTVIKCDDSYSDNYFNNRPYESKLGSWASDQSSEVGSREELMKLVEEFKNKFTPEDIKRPPFWGGWVLTANYYEFWQGRKSRLHDRLVYEKIGTDWKIKRLAP